MEAQTRFYTRVEERKTARARGAREHMHVNYLEKLLISNWWTHQYIRVISNFKKEKYSVVNLNNFLISNDSLLAIILCYLEKKLF